MQPAFEDMSPTERILYVQDLWDQIAAHSADVPVSDTMKTELDRRLADHLASPDDILEWEAVKAQSRRGR